jgi:disulfide bond formation protein DsbB
LAKETNCQLQNKNMIQSNITAVVAFLTLLSNIVFCCFYILRFTLRRISELIVYTFVNKYVLQLIFGSSMAALIGSLLYSNVAGFPPCELCWIQRIFMYPQALLSFMAMIWRDKRMVTYLFPMSILGGLVALYHSLTNWGYGGSLLGCTSVGGECSRVYVLEYGYITIPFMALTNFCLPTSDFSYILQIY